jgi:hypothetical protein
VLNEARRITVKERSFKFSVRCGVTKLKRARKITVKAAITIKVEEKWRFFEVR